ncbi:MAG: DNA primase [Bacteroidales bacterium]|nr:DNA primase [Bacteroidales bacterium]
MIKQDTIQTILEVARIEDVVGDFVNLRKRGVNLIGLCPFHNEKTPSFTVSPAKGIYKCFGCGKAGNSVGFIMEHEHYSYPEALKYLAKKYTIDIDEEQLTAEEQDQMDSRESMFALNSFVSGYFQDYLLDHEEGKSVGLSYLKERDFLESTIKKFQLGFAPSRDLYSDYALKNGYKKDLLLKTGLSIDKGDRLVDRFRGRVIFPIHNLTGRIIGFGGRVLTSEKTVAKYLNSPESDIYNKSKSLYGIFFARNEILKKDNCYLVEGYTDVISLHQAGIENVVASSGTSLTADQIKIIKRFTPNITILYDGDTAGIKASFRGIDMILEQGMNVKIVLFPDGEDPDSFARSHTSSELESFVEKEAMDFISFKTRLLMDETQGDPVARATLIKEIVQTISQIPDAIIRTVYIKECSAVMDLPEQTLMNALNKLLRDKFRKQNFQKTDEEPIIIEETYESERQTELDPFDISEQENEIIRLLLLYGPEKIKVTETVEDEMGEMVDIEQEVGVAEFILESLDYDNVVFENKTYNRIIKEIKDKISTGDIPDESYFVRHPEKEISTSVIDLIAEPYELSHNWVRHKIYVKKEDDDLHQTLVTTLNTFRIKLITRTRRDITNRLKDATDEGEISVLMQQFYELKKVAREIDQELKRPFDY